MHSASCKSNWRGITVPFAILVAVGVAPPAIAQALTKCTLGQVVVDSEGKMGTVVSDGPNLCEVNYPDGATYGWIYWNLRSAGAADASASTSRTDLPAPNVSSHQTSSVPRVLRPLQDPTLTYRADARGHVTIDTMVNGAPVKFLVDTGASLVYLTVQDAEAAGFSRGGLVFSERAQTANGSVRIAPLVLREIRIEQFTFKAIPAAVIEKLDSSVLGMSLLSRLKGFEMQNGIFKIK